MTYWKPSAIFLRLTSSMFTNLSAAWFFIVFAARDVSILLRSSLSGILSLFVAYTAEKLLEALYEH